MSTHLMAAGYRIGAQEMSLEMEVEVEAESKTSIEALPDVVLEYILCHLSLYRDLLECRLVSKHWHSVVNGTVEKMERDFNSSLVSNRLEWDHFSFSPESGPTISGRYSHSSCLVGESLYVFGGCTVANTTFNDLWQLSLSDRLWVRPLATGTYPPPKACASLVRFQKTRLVLFGGWTLSSPYPLHQDWKIFNHIHEFDTITSRWSLVSPKTDSPGIAGHCASIVKNEMVIFGGLRTQVNNPTAYSSTNDLWVFNFDTLRWRNQTTLIPKPAPRYGHSQIILDPKHILILGGCGGPNMLFNDAWLLTIIEEPQVAWYWKQIYLKGLTDSVAIPSFNFHPATKINDLVVILSNSQKSQSVKSVNELNPRRTVERSHFSNSSHNQTEPRESKLEPQSNPSTQQPLPDDSRDNAVSPVVGHLKPSIRPNARCDRQRLLAGLNKMEQRIKSLRNSSVIKLPTIRNSSSYRSSNPMSLYVLDISQVLKKGMAYWLPQKKNVEGPDEVILYTLVAGKSEIIMFGGLKKDRNKSCLQSVGNSIPDIVSNTLHVVRAAKEVI